MNYDRFYKRLKEINSIGYKENKGISRLALTNEDMLARELIKSYMREMGLYIKEDGVGNIWGRKEGLQKDLPTILFGSHIDTVPNGGGFDGTLGVITALESLQLLIEEEAEFRHSVEVVVFNIEESSRFNISTVGSKAVIGEITTSDLYKYRDKDDLSLYNELVKRHFSPEKIENINPAKYKSFIELHIEQGPILESEKIDIGIVQGIAAPTRLKLKLIGSEAHSGSCPMNARRDALTAASEIILEVEKIGIIESVNNTVATTGNCIVFPGAMNVVPGGVDLLIDIRGTDIDSIDRTTNYIIKKTETVCKKRNIDKKIDVICNEKPIILDKRVIDQIKTICVEEGLTYKEMISGAGHDTMNISKVIPSAMVFIPCIDGVSHNKKENVSNKDLKNSLDIMYGIIKSMVTPNI